MQLSESLLEQKPRVELLPLLDVMFLLLVFFIFAMLTMVVHRGVEVTLPGAATAELDTQPAIHISIAADGAITLEGELVSIDVLPARVAAARTEVEGRPVFIRGDRSADLGIALGVLDALREAGIEQVSFASAPREGAVHGVDP